LRRLVRLTFGLALALVLTVAGLSLLYAVVAPVSTLMLGRWLTLRGVERVPAPLSGISPNLPLAVLASEDARFCQHGGVDWEALRSVIEEADEDGPSRGASTVAMQTAKNLFLWPGRSVVRKALELPLALWIDLVWGKRRVMEVYLNIAEWGEGVFGAEAASRRAFGKSAADLTRREAALLAAALPNPILRDAARPGPGHRRLAARLMERMEAAGPSLIACVKAGGRSRL
jgi:monofunctional biosynthetic peptidoglycan transglycosylase